MLTETSGKPQLPARGIAVMLLLCVVLAPIAAAAKKAEARSEDYIQGRTDGEKDARGRGIWILSGLFLGPIGLILPWVTTPQVPATSLVGKSADYLEGYQDGYVSKVRPKNFLYSLAGFGITAATAAVVAISVAAVRTAAGAAQGCSTTLGEGCANAITPDISCTAIPVP
jgi:hypothetical protein